MPSKKVNVSAHLREGRAVQAHDRTIESKTDGVVAKTDRGETTDALLGLVNESAVASKDNDTERGVTHTGGQMIGKLEHAKYENCVFSHVNFSRVDFRGAELNNCTFEGCHIVAPRMSNALFRNCKFDDMRFLCEDSVSRWIDTKFEGSEFIDTEMNATRMTGGGFSNCTLANFKILEGSVLENVKFSDSTFNILSIGMTNLPGSVFERCDFSGGTGMIGIGKASQDDYNHYIKPLEGMNFKIRDSKMSGGYIRDSNFKNAEITNCTFDRVDFTRVEATEADFSGTKGNVSFQHSELRQANVTNATLEASFSATPVFGSKWAGSSINCSALSHNENLYPRPFYEQYSFEKTMKESGLTANQFEFMVLSGAIEVRDNDTMEKVTSGFDPQKQHITPWAFENITRIASKSENAE